MHSTTSNLPDDVDIGDVPPQPAAISHRCPVRVALDHDPSRRHLRSPPDPSELARGEEAQRHVEAIRELLGASSATDPDVVVIDRDDADGEAATLRAIKSDARLVIGARLPTDPSAHRLGCNTVLSRSAEGGWCPIEIRRHILTREAFGSTLEASPIDDPHPGSAATVRDRSIRTRRHNENGRQLAHRWRLLEAMGAVLPGQRAIGGVVDSLGDRVWWIDLEDPRWPTRWTDRKVTMLEHYDHGFDFRLRTIAHQAGQDGPLMGNAVPPVRIGECSSCPWEALCVRELEAVDHVSLIPRSAFDHYVVHKARGITTRSQLAGLHWPTAYAMHGPDPRSTSVDVVQLLAATADLPPETPIADVLHPAGDGRAVDQVREQPGEAGSPIQLSLLEFDPFADAGADPQNADLDDPVGTEARSLDVEQGDRPATATAPIVAAERVDQVVERFAEVGVRTVADLTKLDHLTASYSGEPCGHLPSVIDQARASTADRPFLARGVARPLVPRADVEVDVDMENVEAGVYLWGSFVSGDEESLARIDLRPGYHPFWDWEPMDDNRQARVFSTFWSWLSEVRASCASFGLSFAAYCYTSAEHQKMLQVLDSAPEERSFPLPERREVDELVRSSEWVDVYDVVRSSLVVGHGLGLKRIAPLAGFGWRDDDAGGLQSMAWHREVMENPDPAVQAFNRARLLAYNEDDVRATLAVRNWLSSAHIPSIEEWDG